MSYITVKFMDKEYSIPEDVITYADLVDFTNEVKDTLLSLFKRQIANNVDIIESDNFMISAIDDQASKFIRRLLGKDIYDRTVHDYLQDNKGYELFLDTKKKAIKQLIAIRKEKLETYRAGVEDALSRKEASVTGLDFGIISGSFVNHMIYAYMDASKQMKQEREALNIYNQEIQELDRKATAYDWKESCYIKENLIPAMNTVFTLLAYELLDKFIADLIRADKFDKEALKYIDLKRSSDLLGNLDLSDNKSAVIERAFIACPFNIEVYMQVMKYNLLDYDSFQVSKVFKQSSTILSFLEGNLGEVSFTTKSFNIDYHCAELLAQFTEKQSSQILRPHTEQYALGILKEYSNVINMLSDAEFCRKVMAGYPENEILAGDAICKRKAYSYVNIIVSSVIWDQLVEKCGHSDLLERIKTICISSPNEISKKDEIDKYIVEQLYSVFENERIALAAEIIKHREAEAEQEKNEQERRKKNKKIAAITAPVVAAVVVFVAVLNMIIIPNSKYNQALDLYNSGDYDAAIDAFIAIDGYKDSADRVSECKYSLAVESYNNGNYDTAKEIFESIQNYKDASRWIGDCYIQVGDYQSAISAYDSGEIVIPEGVTHIGAEAFKGCDTLTSITIPSSVERIGEDAFSKCENLKNVYISDLSKWCEINFDNMGSNPLLYGESLYINGTLATAISIPEDIIEISDYAFTSCDCVISIVMGNNVRKIGSEAFSGCDSLTKIILSNNITAINDYTFHSCSSLTDIIIPNGVTMIGKMAFGVCEGLSEIIIPDSVMEIDEWAFVNCDNLVSITIPNSVKTIDSNTFDDCDSLKEVTIPVNVTYISENAFADCENLTEIKYEGTIDDWKNIEKESSWNDGTSAYAIYCTDGQISAAQNAIFECEAGDVITFGTYEQDGNSNNGTEAIEWIVLERNGNNAFLLSLYCLEQMPFNNTLAPVVWENCTLRKWLNDTFLGTAFSRDEQSKIILSKLFSYENETTDKIFLLSKDEVNKYLSSSGRRAEATEYVSTNHCYWFLRTPAGGADVAYVSYDGEVGYWEKVDRNWWVRPAMWIEIDN